MEEQSRNPIDEPTSPAIPDNVKLMELLQASQACIANAPIAVFRIDENGKLIDVNDRACSSLGFTRAELLGMTVFDIDPTFTPEKWLTHRKNLKGQGSRSLETIHRRKDGTTFPVEVKVNYYEFQGVQYSYSFAQDISDRKKTEEALKHSQNRFRTLAEASFEGVALTKQGIIIDLNDQSAQMLGYTREELLGTQVSLCVAPQDRQKVTDFMRSGNPEPYEHLTLCKDGTTFPVEIRARTTIIDGEEIRVSVIRDIREQKRAEANLRKLNHLESEALQVARLGHWEYDTGSGYFTFNDQYYALHGTTAEKAGGYQMSAQDFARTYVHPDDAHLVQEAIQKAIETKDSDFNYQIDARVLKEGGEVADFFVWFRIEKDETGKTIKLHGVNQDITERKRAETALRESEFFLRKSQDVGELGSYYFDARNGSWISSTKLDQIFGFDNTYPKTIEGWMEIIHPDHKAEMLDHLMQHVIAGHNRFDKEYRIIRHNDQQERWVHGLGELEFDQVGNTIKMIGTIQDITERKQAEDALHVSEERLRLVLEATSDAIWDWNIQTNEVYFSPHYYTMLGFEPAEFPASYEKWQSLLHPGDRSATVELIQRIIAENGSFSTEFRMETKNEDWCWILGRGKVVQLDELGKAIRILGTHTDITKRKQAEIALQQSEAQLRLLTDNMVDVIIQTDPEYNILYMSPSGERAYAINPLDFTGKSVTNWTHPDDLPLLIQAGMEARKSRKPSIRFEYRWLMPDGRYLWREATVRLLYETDGSSAGAIFCSRDISERKRAENLLHGMNGAALAMQRAVTPKQIFNEASEQLKKLGFYCSIFKMNADLTTMPPVHLTYKGHAIEKLENLTGFQAQKVEIPIQALDEFRQPIMEKRTIYIENIKQTVKQFLPQSLARLAQPIVKILGVSSTINSPLIVDNEVIGLLAVQSDDLSQNDVPVITAFAHQLAAAWKKAQLFEQAQQEVYARKEAEAEVRKLNEELEKRVNERTTQLKTANEELEAFAYSVSHDLRAPLRAINGYTRILTEDYEPILDEEGKRICGVITTEATHMGQLIDDLLAFFRLGRAEMQIFSVDMNALVNSVYHDLTLSEDMKRIKFHKAKLANVEADPNLLRQVWTNLLSNAIKFSQNCPIAEIEVGCSQDENEVTYWVRDNGAGFDMRYQDKLFGVFQRLHNTDEFEGTGVGLAIVQRIVHRHNGRVWATGKVGEGATFSFALPKKGKEL